MENIMNNDDEYIYSSIQENWDEIKRKVQQDLSVSEISYSLWIEPLILEEVRNNYVYIGCEKDDERALEYLHKRFNLAFGTVIYEKVEKVVTVIFKLKGTCINSESEDIYHDENKLDYKYTFESFIEGKCNKISVQVSMAIAKNPGELWNPYFLYGESGLGKTHLLNAIGNYILNNDSTKNVVYVTCKQYLKDIVDSLRNCNGRDTFKAKYINADILLIDDLDQIAGKEASLELFTDMLDIFRETNKQVVVTSDRNFREFDKATDRFMNRIAYGIITDLTAFDHETSHKIISMIAENKGIRLSEDVVHYLSKCYGNSFPKIQNVVNKIELYSKQINRSYFEEIDEISKNFGE